MADIVRETSREKPYWVQYVHSRIRKNQNFLANCWGPTGSGKSYSFISFACMLDPEFNIDRIVFSGEKLMELINSGTLKKGSVILWDETGVDQSSREWQSLANRMINFLLQTFRHKNIILLFTAPYSDFIDKGTRKLFHAEFKTLSIDYVNKTTKVQAKLLQYNPDLQKFYRKYLRVITKDEGVLPIVEWNIPAPEKELARLYEAKKSAFTDKLNKDIEISLRKVNKDGRKPLTELQQKIVGCWKEGMFKQRDIASTLDVHFALISQNIAFMRRKGYYKEDYQK